MSKTVVRKNETLEDALRRFKRAVSKMELSKKFVNANFMKNQAFVVRKNLKRLENVNINNW